MPRHQFKNQKYNNRWRNTSKILRRNQESNSHPTPDLPQVHRRQLATDRPRAYQGQRTRHQGGRPTPLGRSRASRGNDKGIPRTLAIMVVNSANTFECPINFRKATNLNFRAPLWPHNFNSYALQCEGKTSQNKKKNQSKIRTGPARGNKYITTTSCFAGRSIHLHLSAQSSKHPL